jgi:hypothetical protein
VPGCTHLKFSFSKMLRGSHILHRRAIVGGETQRFVVPARAGLPGKAATLGCVGNGVQAHLTPALRRPSLRARPFPGAAAGTTSCLGPVTSMESLFLWMQIEMLGQGRVQRSTLPSQRPPSCCQPLHCENVPNGTNVTLVSGNSASMGSASSSSPDLLRSELKALETERDTAIKTGMCSTDV